MSEIVKLELETHPEKLNSLEVDGILVLVGEKREGEWDSETLRCLDWSLNHQLRKALACHSQMAVFVPTMSKVKSGYVILCNQGVDKNTVEKSIESMGFKSLAILSNAGPIPQKWTHWGANIRSVWVEMVNNKEGSRGI